MPPRSRLRTSIQGGNHASLNQAKFPHAADISCTIYVMTTALQLTYGPLDTVVFLHPTAIASLLTFSCLAINNKSATGSNT